MSLYQRTAAIAAFSLMLGLGAAACGKKQAGPDAAATRDADDRCRTAGATRAARGAACCANAAHAHRGRDVRAEVDCATSRQRSPFGDVYFDLDNSSIKDEGRTALTTNANY